jgi:predicted nucleic acid-binding protein
MIYLLDTNILSEPSRVKPDPHVSRRLMEPDLRLVTASVVWLELWSGFHRLETSRPMGARPNLDVDQTRLPKKSQGWRGFAVSTLKSGLERF